MYCQSNNYPNYGPMQLVFNPFITPSGVAPVLATNAQTSIQGLFIPVMPTGDTHNNCSMVPGLTKCRNIGLYKTELCRYWCAGAFCKFGLNCWFAHGPLELQKVKNQKRDALAKKTSSLEVFTPQFSLMSGTVKTSNENLGNISEQLNTNNTSSKNNFTASDKVVDHMLNIKPQPNFAKAVGAERSKEDAVEKLSTNKSKFKHMVSMFWDSGIENDSDHSEENSITFSTSRVNLCQFPTLSEDSPNNLHPSPSMDDVHSYFKKALENDGVCEKCEWCGESVIKGDCQFAHLLSLSKDKSDNTNL